MAAGGEAKPRMAPKIFIFLEGRAVLEEEGMLVHPGGTKGAPGGGTRRWYPGVTGSTHQALAMWAFLLAFSQSFSLKIQDKRDSSAQLPARK